MAASPAETCISKTERESLGQQEPKRLSLWVGERVATFAGMFAGVESIHFVVFV